MKKFLMFLGIVLLVVLIGGGGWVWMTIQEGVKLDETSRLYVQTNIPKLAEGRWYGPIMRPMAHPALMQAVTQEQWHDMSVRYYRTLGAFKNMDTCQGQATINYTQAGKEVSAEYVCPAQFANAPALVKVTLLKDTQNAWKIVKLYVESDAFLK